MRAKPSHYYYLEIQSTFGFPSNVLCMCAGGKGGGQGTDEPFTHTLTTKDSNVGEISNGINCTKRQFIYILKKSNAKTKNTPPLVINRIIHTHTNILPKKI